MSGQRRLASVPSWREQQVLEWLDESESVPSGPILDTAFSALPRVRQRRAWPWTRLGDQLRPEPFGSPRARLVAIAIAAMLLLMLFAGTLLTAGQRDFTAVIVEPAPTVSPSASAAVLFPLQDPVYDLVIGNENSRMFSIRSDGTNRRAMAEDINGSLAMPDWGPGTSVLVQESSPTTDQIWQVDAAVSRPSQVVVPCVAPCASRNEASWSNDGMKIVLFQALGVSENGFPKNCGLGLYDAAALAVTELTSSPCAVSEERHARFAPDDASIAFWRSRSPGLVQSTQIEDSAIFTRELATGRETQVTDWATHASMLDWSPDGAWIAFIPDTYDETASDADLWRVHPDGTGLGRMTTLDTADLHIQWPRYSPDGAWILFVRVSDAGGELLAIPADGGEPVSVLPGTMVFDFDVRSDP